MKIDSSLMQLEDSLPDIDDEDSKGGCHDQAVAEWIVIRRLLLLRGHNDISLRRPSPGWPIGRPGVGHPWGIFGVFSNY
jgi:hypothetical protein